MVLLVDERPEEVTDMRRHVLRGEVVASHVRPSRPTSTRQVAELTIERAKRLVEMRQGRRDHPRRHHPPGPGLQPRGAGVGPDHVGWCRRRRAVPAEEVLRRGAQRRGGRLAHDPRHRARRDRHPRWTRSSSRSSRAPATWSCGSTGGSPSGGSIPAIDVERVEHPPRGAAVRPRRAPAGLEAAPGARTPWRRRAGAGPRAADRQDPHAPRATTSSSPRSPRPRPGNGNLTDGREYRRDRCDAACRATLCHRLDGP